MKRSERLPKAAKGDGSAIPQVEHLKESAELAKPDRKEFIGEGQETRREIKPSSKGKSIYKCFWKTKIFQKFYMP